MFHVHVAPWSEANYNGVVSGLQPRSAVVNGRPSVECCFCARGKRDTYEIKSYAKKFRNRYGYVENAYCVGLPQSQ